MMVTVIFMQPRNVPISILRSAKLLHCTGWK